MKNQQRVAVIGAGMGGLPMAVLLQNAGFDVNVYEQSKQFARIGAGINIYPNGMHVLRAVGVVDRLLSLGQLPKTWLSRVWNTGEVLICGSSSRCWRHGDGEFAQDKASN